MQVDTADARGREGMDEGDRFGAVFFAHASRLVRLAALLGDDDPEDVVQESFCKLYAARGRLRADDAQVVAYLNRIVVNEVRSRHRRRQVARRDAHLLTDDAVADPHASHGDRRAVVEALAGLPPRQREALVLRFWMDLPLAAIAEAMGVRLGTVKSQISRGLDVVGAALVRGGGTMTVEERLARALHDEAERVDVDVAAAARPHPGPAAPGTARPVAACWCGRWWPPRRWSPCCSAAASSSAPSTGRVRPVRPGRARPAAWTRSSAARRRSPPTRRRASRTTPCSWTCPTAPRRPRRAWALPATPTPRTATGPLLRLGNADGTLAATATFTASGRRLEARHHPAVRGRAGRHRGPGHRRAAARPA